jgi:hypothetical protein
MVFMFLLSIAKGVITVWRIRSWRWGNLSEVEFWIVLLQLFNATNLDRKDNKVIVPFEVEVVRRWC